jgi:hypothetical protein
MKLAVIVYYLITLQWQLKAHNTMTSAHWVAVFGGFAAVFKLSDTDE